MGDLEESSESGSARSTRRGLLRLLARSASRHAQDGAAIIGSESLSGVPIFDLVSRADATEAPGTRPSGDRPRTAARAVARAMSAEDLVVLANSEGLAGRDAELMSLARRSFRMTSIDSRSSGAWIRTDDDWLAPGGSEVVVAQIDLTTAAVQQSVLRAAGWLVLSVDPVNGRE